MWLLTWKGTPRVVAQAKERLAARKASRKSATPQAVGCPPPFRLTPCLIPPAPSHALFAAAQNAPLRLSRLPMAQTQAPAPAAARLKMSELIKKAVAAGVSVDTVADAQVGASPLPFACVSTAPRR